MNNEQTITRTQSIINRSAVKSYALKVSRERRAGKFERVGESFIDRVISDIEATIRQIAPPPTCDIVQPEDDRGFITGAALDKVREKLNERARAIISGKVLRHPSVGVTLKD
jgi:hypothetical protein